jgi:DNA topoisomerase-3
MIVARDNEIENFHPEPYWLLTTKYRDVVFTCVDGRFDSEHNSEARRC